MNVTSNLYEVPLLAGRGVSLVVGGGLCSGCVRGGVLRGGGAWPVGREDVVVLRRAGMGVVGWRWVEGWAPGWGAERGAGCGWRGIDVAAGWAALVWVCAARG